MFSWKSWTEIAIRAILTAVIVFNALIPTAALAMPIPKEDETASATTLPERMLGTKGFEMKVSRAPRSQFLFQENTPFPETPTVLVTETLTPESLITPTSTPEGTATPPVMETTTQTPTLEVTAMSSATPTVTSTTPIAPSTLLLEFSASPYQIKTADQVTFKLKIQNQGQSPAAGLQFSNILPEEFNFLAGRNKGFEFDQQTRELTWQADQGTILLPGETLTLEYTLLVIGSKAEDVQIMDTAHLSAAGFIEPLGIETMLILARPDSSFTTVDSQGGEATGLNGKLKLKFLQQALDTSRLISVRDLSKESSGPTTKEPWLKFELGVRAPKKDAALSTSAITEESTAENASANPASQETDEVVPLEFIEAPFAEPVELSVSFDGILDLATLTADITPFLVTLDEASGTWVRIPLEKIDREANLITAQLSHFSTWGIGFGPTFPSNSAGVILFDSAYPSLFTGSSKYSIPIWTPRQPVAITLKMRVSCTSSAITTSSAAQALPTTPASGGK